MLCEYLDTGKIVGTHGIHGEVRVQPWCDSPEILKGFDKLFLDKSGNQYIEVEKSRVHGNLVLIKFKGIDSIEAAEKYRGRVLYIHRDDIKLDEGQYFVQDLMGCRVLDVDTGKYLGDISDVSYTGANDVWHIKQDNKEYLIPVIEQVVISVDIPRQTVKIKPLKGIFDHED